MKTSETDKITNRIRTLHKGQALASQIRSASIDELIEINNFFLREWNWGVYIVETKDGYRVTTLEGEEQLFQEGFKEWLSDSITDGIFEEKDYNFIENLLNLKWVDDLQDYEKAN